MQRNTSPLNNISIASPCTADWDNMIGNDQVRHCQQCDLNVYNLSGMTKVAAEDLIRKTEGRLCVRFYQRQDGTIISSDCPVGLAAIKRRISRVAGAAISALLTFFTGVAGLAAWNSFSQNSSNSVRGQVMGQMEYKPSNSCELKPVTKSVSLPVLNQPNQPPTMKMGRMVINPNRPQK